MYFLAYQPTLPNAKIQPPPELKEWNWQASNIFLVKEALILCAIKNSSIFMPSGVNYSHMSLFSLSARQ